MTILKKNPAKEWNYKAIFLLLLALRFLLLLLALHHMPGYSEKTVEVIKYTFVFQAYTYLMSNAHNYTIHSFIHAPEKRKPRSDWGKSVWIRYRTYYITSQNNITKQGTECRPLAYPSDMYFLFIKYCALAMHCGAQGPNLMLSVTTIQSDDLHMTAPAICSLAAFMKTSIILRSFQTLLLKWRYQSLHRVLSRLQSCSQPHFFFFLHIVKLPVILN